MKLYYSKGACSLAVRILLHELNISAEYESVDIKLKKTETGADYYQVNPKGAVPALQLDNGEVLTENAAIQQYLVDTHKAVHLLPAVGDLKRYRVLEWFGYVNSDLHKSFGAFFNSKVPEAIKNEIFVPLLKGKFDYLDKHFSHSQYLLDRYTLPDGYLFVIVRWLSVIKQDLSQWKNVSRYYDELKARPSIKAALREEGIN